MKDTLTVGDLKAAYHPYAEREDWRRQPVLLGVSGTTKPLAALDISRWAVDASSIGTNIVTLDRLMDTIAPLPASLRVYAVGRTARHRGGVRWQVIGAVVRPDKAAPCGYIFVLKTGRRVGGVLPAGLA